MIPFNYAVAAEVRSLVQGADDSTVDSIYRELCQLADCSPDGCILLLQVCLDEVLLSVGVAKNSQSKQDLLSTIFRYCLDKTYFSTCFCEALRAVSVSDVFLETLSNELDLSKAERVGIGLSLSDSENIGLNLKGQRFSIAQIEELCENPSQSISNDQIHDIVLFLHHTDGLSKHIDSFTNIISLFKVKDTPFHVPFLIQDGSIRPVSRSTELCVGSLDDDFDSLLSEIGKEISMAGIITELGYGCTADIAHCKDILSLFEPLNDLRVSKLLGAVVSTTCVGEANSTYSTFISAFGNSQTNDSFQSTAWNVDVLVDSINEIAPRTNWTSVMENLDHEGFNIPDEGAFHLLMSIYSRACKDPFPLHAICGSLWKNLEGQLSFLKHAVAAPVDTFTFKHCSRQMVFPDLANHIQGNQPWYCLDLLEVLCELAELGFARSVRSMLDYPLSHCPEVLFLGVSHINTAYNLLQYEVLSCVFPAILKDTKHSSLVKYLWHLNPSLTLRGFVDSHSDISCLLRIVDICQDLKILSAVLDCTPLAFSIKLATVSFRNDHSNLEKWTIEKLSAQKEFFIEECVNFLKEVMANTNYDAEGVTQQPEATIMNICWESCPLFIKVLRSHSGQLLTNQLLDQLSRVDAAYGSRNHGAVGRDIPTPEGGSDSIEAQANIYFQQMFSEQISIDAMIQMLARFKESTNKRELAIFNCMISNLFEEYKSFPKYPDTQLKLAAVLVGSLIKHQLLAHLGLGIALRSVLDSLRKSVDSKMFMFGIAALEQFMGRVIEWPQYCNHILQISHLRGTHAELVSAIERALATISSSQKEPNISNIFPLDQHGSGSSSVGSIEASEASWQFINPTPTQLERSPSSYPPQQRHQGFLGERSKGSTNSIQAKNIVSASQSFASTPTDLCVTQKVLVPPSSQASPYHSTTISAPSQSTNFLRPRSSAPSGTRPSYTTGFGAALNIETLVAAAKRRDTSVEAPPSEVQDKIFFMINNISTSNLEAKAKEFNEVFQEQYYPWLAQYMVMKRASIEPNFHDLYLKFFDKVNSKSLNKEIVKATYENCKALLQSDLIKSSSEERSLLKNLGSWLGKLTIGRNQTVRAKEIEPKILIVEAYERGLMIAVIPFTSKILEPCHSSTSYRPPNPWTMGILSLLAEIYNLPNLKMNLKFDIEVLFKNLSVDMKDVKPSSFLKDRIRQVEGNPDFSNKDVSASQTPVITEVSSGMIPAKNLVDAQPELTSTSRATSLPNMLNQYAPPLRLAPNNMVEDDKVALIMPDQVSPSQTPSPSPALFTLSQLMAAIPRADIYFRINEKLSSLGSLQYSKIMDVALDKAIKEIIGPVIQRSVTIATRTTKELIIKDLSMESDDSAVSRAAHLMVGTLAGSLAHVTSKEPLRVALSSHLRSLIQNLKNNSESTEQIVHILINDNLDLGCALIETVATRKAVEMIDEEIRQPFSQLRRQKELFGSGYYDAFPYTQGLACVPDALCPKPASHLCATQQQVYEDFITVWHSQSSQNAGATTSATAEAVAPGNSSIPRLYSPNLVPPADLVLEESDHGTTQLLSVSTQIGTSDSFAQVGGTANITSVFPPMSSNDVLVGESTAATEDLGSTIPLSPTTAVDRMESVFAEPLNTEDALDKYQQVAQKVLSGRPLMNKEENDTAFQDQVAVLFSDWCHIYDHPTMGDSAYSHYIAQLQQHGLLKGDDLTEHFFHLLTELAVTHTVFSEQVTAPGGIPQQPAQQLQISYFSIDSYSKLVTLVVKYCVDLAPNKGSLLPKILSVTARTIQKDAEEKKVSFNPRPYFRLFINLLSELSTADLHDGATLQVLTAFANAFRVLQPLRVPAWSFAWLELVSHRSFMPKLLLCNSQKGWPLFQRLLVDLFKFMEPYLRKAEMEQPIHLLYKGTLRVLLVLLHDFPEFLCDYHLSFCDVIPPSCIQMRNVILSAFPRNMRLPDPSTPNLKIDLLPEISKTPRIMSDVESALKAKQMKTQVDEYLKRPEGSFFLTDLKQKLLLPPNEANVAGTRYNVPLINSLAVYVGIQAVQQLHHNKANASTQQMNLSTQVDNFQIETATEVFQNLIVNMDTEGRYLVLNAIANQLRYPNSHTHYFSFIILYLFAEATQDIVQEQITRVLLERLIVNRPHPWGLLITFVELIKNSRYSFWARSFTHCAPEIERLFESVARSCGGKAADEGVVLIDGSH